MSATFALPSPSLGTAIIFVDGVEFDRVSTDTLEYTIIDDDYTDSTITIAYTDGTTTTDELSVTTFEQKLIRSITDKLTVELIPVEQILSLIDISRREIIIDLCKYHYGEELVWIKDNYYKLPNRWFFDYNGGGVVSVLDMEFYKQKLPIYEFTTKDPVVIIAMNARDRWVQLDAKLDGTYVLKTSYYSLQRELKSIDYIELLSFKIIYNYYQDSYANMISSSDVTANKIKVGDITIENTSGTSSANMNYYIDRMNKTNARYTEKLNRFRKGFYRVN